MECIHISSGDILQNYDYMYNWKQCQRTNMELRIFKYHFELWDVCYEDFGDNWLRFNRTTLYQDDIFQFNIPLAYWTTCGTITGISIKWMNL